MTKFERTASSDGPNTDDDYDSNDDIEKSFAAAYEAIRERVANGGPGWGGYPK